MYNSFDNYIVDVTANYIEDTSLIQKIGGIGHFHIEHWRPNAETGELEFLQNIDFHNGITTQGLNSLLGVGFHGDTQITTWYLFPISNTGYSALSAADTPSSHAGWVESSAYSETTRPSWGPGASSGGSITNGTPVVMTVNADLTPLVGMGLSSVSTKAATTGTLWATGLFGSVQNMNTGDVLKITYTVTLTATS